MAKVKACTEKSFVFHNIEAGVSISAVSLTRDLCLGKGRCPKRISLNGDDFLAVIALDLSQIIETFNPQNVSKVNSILGFTSRARTVCNIVVCEDEIFGEFDSTSVNWVGTKSGKEKRVKTDNWFNDLETKSEPSDEKECSCW